MQSSHVVVAVVGLAVVSSLSLTGPVRAEEGSDLPFEVTEDRPRCKNYDPRRQALFGTTHLHTGLSFDASIRFVDYGSGNNPRGAYRFAKGGHTIQLPDPSGLQNPGEPIGGGPSRSPMIDRPLDWGGVTDHSEHFGVMGFCKPGFQAGKEDKNIRQSMECRMLNGFFYEPKKAANPAFGRNVAANAFTNLTVVNDGAVSLNTNLPVCENNPELCAQAELEVWTEIQLAAEEAYDRTDHCRFTSFIAYENTSTPLLNNWHRNVFFRNDRVVKKPVNAIDMAVRVNQDPTSQPVDTVAARTQYDDELCKGYEPYDKCRVWPVPNDTLVNHPLPQPFWNKLEMDCTEGKNVTDGRDKRCDFITIPHNSNLGGGSAIFPPMFLDPYNTADAERHAQMEPLVEIYQDKGSSECRYDPRYLAGTDTIDEFCAFEILDGKTLGSASGVGSGESGGPSPPDTWGERAYVRNVWKDGIQYAAAGTYEGINPFKMGVVAASDSHTGVMGWHPETEEWPGHLGIDDAYPMSRASTIQNGSGGHSVVWAEENSRDSIFAALKRKETYGTSGTRPIVRFFGGWNFPDDACTKDLVALGYRDGVPMGGDLPPRGRYEGAPRFIAAAWRDDHIKTNLQQIQIVKGWVTKGVEIVDGKPKETYKTHEQVYTVAGSPGSALNAQADVDPVTCKPKPELGHVRLCTVWQDPHFDAEQHAFYYVRVLEEPVCRYSTLWCRRWIGVDPLDTTKCQQRLAKLQAGGPDEQARASQGAECCSNQTTDTFLQPVIQERAWTSPIWYDPR